MQSTGALIGSARTNPAVFALECSHQVKIGPNIKSGRVIENVYIFGIQHHLRKNNENADSCFGYGSSTENQKIESWKSQFRYKYSNWWINYFEEMRDQSVFHSSESSILFWFFIFKLLKSHSIRTKINSECPSGHSLVTFEAPERRGVCEVPSYFDCPAEFLNSASVTMRQNNWHMSKSISKAYHLHVTSINQ